MPREEEEEEVRSLLLRHRERIMLDLCQTDLLAILVKNSVLSQSEEDFIVKTFSIASAPSSALPITGITKRKLSAAISSGSSNSNNTVTSYGESGVGEEGCSITAEKSSNNSCSAGALGENEPSENHSITPSLASGSGADGNDCSIDQRENNFHDNSTNVDVTLNLNSVNAPDIFQKQSTNLIEIIAEGGFSKFKQFCYAIDNECPKLIEDLFNDKAKCDAAINNTSPIEDKVQNDDAINYTNKETENDRNRRAVSYNGEGSNINTLPRAAPRRISLMKDPPPPPPPRPKQCTLAKNIAAVSPIPSKYIQSDCNLIQNIDSSSTITTPVQYQLPKIHKDGGESSASNSMVGSNNNYSSLLCHGNSASSPTDVRKREKLLHRFSDAATLGRKLKKKKNTNRTCRSMTEAIEMLADPVIEDEFFGDRTTWEYHTVSVTRVPGYGFGIAVSGGRDNPHFANGDPSIAVSDVLKGGPAEDRLQVNDRIISVNGVSLENVEYATAVQVLRDSGNTVALVIKRRVPLSSAAQNRQPHNMSSMGVTPPNASSVPIHGTSVIPGTLSQSNSLSTSLVQNNTAQPIKVTLSKGSKKDDYGIVLGCRLFIKEISTKARDQLAANGYSLQEGDVITRIHNTNCGDTMSLKEAKKLIDGCKERLNLVVLRDITNQAVTAMTNQLNNSTTQSNLYISHQAQLSNCSNNLEDPYFNGGTNYSSQNLYVQPPTRSLVNGSSNGINDEKSNLTPRGRSRGPIMDAVSLSQLDRPVTPPNDGRPRTEEPPRPPPPRGNGTGSGDNFYSSRRQIYESDQLANPRQSSEPRFISFQKEGSVGIRLTGGNESGIFVTAVQPGSPASLQGLTPGDKIVKVNDMDMHGVTREEAVLFLLSLQDRIDLIVQYCKEEYEEVVTNQRGDSFHIKTHFHCDNPSKGEMAFKAGDVFRVIDTLHNGVVGSWQVLKIGRGHQEIQRGVIPNKSRAEELATAQFNANKKEMNSNESRGNFFRRRRSTHRRSKSLSRENWDDVVFADSISKFPAYERVVLRHPGFVRPLVLFGPVSDLARERLAKDFPDKFSLPLQDDDKSNSKCRIVRLSNIRDIMDRGKHALLDITPNAVDRLNYAQFYPIVIFLKTDSKHVIKQLRHGLPKSAHKSSKKLLEQCQKLERIWSHIFSTQIVLSDEESWYRKLRDAIDLQQSGAVWMSESKPIESLSDDFLFPMTTSRLSYASSPESDLELSPGPSTSLSLGNLPQLVKSSSDPSIATNQDNLDRARDTVGDGLPPPYTIPFDHAVNLSSNCRQTMDDNKYGTYATGSSIIGADIGSSDRPQSFYGIHAPDLPPRIDRQLKPGPGDIPTPLRTNSSTGTLGRSAQECLFGKAIVNDEVQAEYISRSTNDSMDRHHASLERQALLNAAISNPPASGNKVTHQNSNSYDSVSSYDSYNTSQLTVQNLGRLGPNAPDDLKSVPNASRPLPPAVSMNSQSADYARTLHDHRNFPNDLNRQNSPVRPPYIDGNSARNIDTRNGQLLRPSNLGIESSPRKSVVETKTDYGKYSRNNSVTQADYNKLPKNPHLVAPPPSINGNSGNGSSNNISNGPFKPVPPPKPKNYRPPIQGGNSIGAPRESGDSSSPRSPNGFFYPSMAASHQNYAQQTPGSPGHNNNNKIHPIYGSNSSYVQQSQYPPPQGNGYVGNHHYNGGSGTGPYIAPHRGMPAPIGNIPSHTPERNPLDLAGSREQRGSAFELYRKPQIGTSGHHHNIREMQHFEERFDERYTISPFSPGHPCSRPASRYSRQIDFLPPPSNLDPYYYNYQMCSNYSEMPREYYEENLMPPPLPPHKVKKKSVLKSPLVAIKNAFIKSTRPLRRMNSMVEPERIPKLSLKRQHSLLERGMQRPCYPDEYPTYPAGFENRYYDKSRSGISSYDVIPQEQFYSHQFGGQNGQNLINSTYQNLESEDIYGNIGTEPRVHRERRGECGTNGHENLYANRAFIDLERRQGQAMAAVNQNGRKIVRRHSTTTADRMENKRLVSGISNASVYGQDEICQSKLGNFAPNNQLKAPSSDVMARRRFYPATGNEVVTTMYQSRPEIQSEVRRNLLEQCYSPQSSSQSERDEKSDRDSIYQSRREVKESAMKTRAQLREQIYQTRREALDSMAEPTYVSKKKDAGRPEPIYETKEESILQSQENETDERKEEKTECTVIEINQTEETLSRSDLQKSSDTVIENTLINTPIGKAPLVECEDVDADLEGADGDEPPYPPSINPIEHKDIVLQTLSNENCELSDEVFDNTNVIPSQLIVEGPPIKPLEPLTSTKVKNCRLPRIPFHISNILKLTGPPPNATIADSCTSLETQYTSQGSLPVGPPKASSTPYTSNMSLPIAGPVPISTPNAPIATGISPTEAFPCTPREPCTTRGIFDSNGGTLADNVWNVSLQIPPNAIPTGVRQEIYFTVSDPRFGEGVGGPPLDMENGETMLSPLVMCGPQGLEFLVPVTLNIPHCAGRTASLGLALKATDSEKNLHTEWDNIDLPSNAAAHTVSVKVDHF